MTFYFSSFFIHVIQAVPHTKYRRACLILYNLLLIINPSKFIKYITYNRKMIKMIEQNLELVVINIKSGRNTHYCHVFYNNAYLKYLD